MVHFTAEAEWSKWIDNYYEKSEMKILPLSVQAAIRSESGIQSRSVMPEPTGAVAAGAVGAFSDLSK